ncbi:hypothetical protein [Candidatus Harpocratesius sp.]
MSEILNFTFEISKIPGYVDYIIDESINSEKKFKDFLVEFLHTHISHTHISQYNL